MATFPGLLIAAKTMALVCGGLLTILSYRAHKRTNRTALRALTLGFGLVTLGAIVDAVLYFVAPTPLPIGATLQSLLVAIGLAVLVYSLYGSGIEADPV